MSPELLRLCHQIRKTAAETPSCHLFRIHPMQAREFRIHERITLVIQDHGGSESPAFQFPCRRQDQRRFSSSQKPANENQSRPVAHVFTSISDYPLLQS